MQDCVKIHNLPPSSSSEMCILIRAVPNACLFQHIRNVWKVWSAKHWHWQTTHEIFNRTWHFTSQNSLWPFILQNLQICRDYSDECWNKLSHKNRNRKNINEKATKAVLWKCSQTSEEWNATRTLRICHNNVGSRQQPFEICSTMIKPTFHELSMLPSSNAVLFKYWYTNR